GDGRLTAHSECAPSAVCEGGRRGRHFRTDAGRKFKEITSSRTSLIRSGECHGPSCFESRKRIQTNYRLRNPPGSIRSLASVFQGSGGEARDGRQRRSRIET